jgi:hypothetical protein
VGADSYPGRQKLAPPAGDRLDFGLAGGLPEASVGIEMTSRPDKDWSLTMLAEARRRLVNLRELKVDPRYHDRAREEANLQLAIDLLQGMLARWKDEADGP